MSILNWIGVGSIVIVMVGFITYWFVVITEIRVYRTTKGVWGFGLSKSMGGWHLQFAKWVVTTEVDSGRRAQS